MHFTDIQDLLIALALGLLVGLQREWSKSRVAGVRTFPLISLFGALTAELAAQFGGWIVGAGVAALAALLVVANLAKLKAGTSDPGLTTEISALAMFGVGAAIPAGLVGPAIVATGSIAVLLQFKEQLHGFVGHIAEADLRAAARLVLIGLVILPALPDASYGPFGVLNPYRIWLMVVLIVGISLAAYMSYRALGPKAGSWAAGLLGGLISSTATTATYADAGRKSKALAEASTAVIVTASTVVFARVLAEIAVVAPSALPATAPPLLAVMAFMIVLSLAAQRRASSPVEAGDVGGPPSTLRTAIAFGLLYALVLLAVAFAKEQLGNRGLYAVAALSGLTDMDAITLSTVQLIKAGSLEATTGWRLILVGAMANLVFKAGIVLFAGSRALSRGVFAYFAPALACGILILMLWR